MTQQVTISTESNFSIKPLVQAALRNEIKIIQHGIDRTRDRLSDFEGRFGMPSDEFERRYNNRELEESLDFIDWIMEIQALRLLDQQHQALDEAKVD